jgi:hypothetical protein
MAIAFNASADLGNTGGGTSTLTTAYTCSSGSNRLLVVGVIGDTTLDNVTGVTYNGVAMTLAVKQTTVFSNNRVTYLFYLLNPASGSNNVVISASVAEYLFGLAADYTGVGQFAQPDNTIANIGANTSITTLTTSLTTILDNCWTVGIESGFGGIPSASSGDSLRVREGAFNAGMLFDSNMAVTPPQSYGMTTTRSSGSDSIIHVIASFSPPGDTLLAQAWM